LRSTRWRSVLVGMAALALSGGGRVGACPTCLNLLPTAEVLEGGSYTVQLEVDGASRPPLEGARVHLLSGVGVGHGVEVGLDVIDLNAASAWSADAKWQLFAEDERRPALALGGLDLSNRAGGRQWYVVASRDVRRLEAQLTLGLLSGDVNRGMVGFARALDARTDLQADWMSGPESHATVGLSRELSEGWSGLVYYARNNTREGDDFVGLNLTYSGAWGTE
jgi:hypothetical protein